MVCSYRGLGQMRHRLLFYRIRRGVRVHAPAVVGVWYTRDL